MRPRVDFTPILQKLRLDIMGLKDHRHMVTRPNCLPEQALCKAQCKDVVDVEQRNRQIANETDSLVRQLRGFCRKHDPIERGTAECVSNPSRILCSDKPSIVDWCEEDAIGP